MCPICGKSFHQAFVAKVLNKYDAMYEQCDGCGFLRAHEPHWLDEAYSSAIAAADTGLVARNIAISKKIAGILYLVFGERGEGRYLDVAGGYGMLVRLMRDIGFDFYWADKYCENLFARGFEHKLNDVPCRAVTAIEVMEHLVDPVSFVKETITSNDADALIFTTELYAGGIPRPEDWWYYSFSTGQHIGFFRRQTLEILAARLGFHFVSACGMHVFSRSPISARRFALVLSPYLSNLSVPWLMARMKSRVFSDHENIVAKNLSG